MRSFGVAAVLAVCVGLSSPASGVTAVGDEVPLDVPQIALADLVDDEGNADRSADVAGEDVQTVPIPTPLALLMTACLGLIVAAGRDA